MTIQEGLAKLRDMIGEAGRNYYQRIKIAEMLLREDEWIRTEHNSNSYTAAKVLEDLYFHDLCGAMTLFDLLTIYNKYPAEADWKTHKYNLRKMFDTCRKAVPKRSVERVKRADYDKTLATVKELEYRLNRQTEQIQEAETLVAKVARLERENAKLKGRIEELERILDRFGASIPA